MNRFKEYLEAPFGQSTPDKFNRFLGDFDKTFRQKPLNINDFGTKNTLWLNELELEEEEYFLDLLDEIEHFNAEEVFGKNKKFSFLNKFKQPMPDHFLLSVNGKAFLVETQGFNYVRYALYIPDFVKENKHA